MTSSLDSTYGVWLISLFLETVLYGIGVLQVWLYFHWYPSDSRKVKAVVLLLLALETLQLSFFFSATYKYLIEGFGNFHALTVIIWEDSAQLLSGYLSAFTVQLYFAYCLYVLNERNRVGVVLIVFLALTQIGAGIAQTIVTSVLSLPSTELKYFAKLDFTRGITSVQSGATLACDIVITVSLCLTFKKIKTGMKTTNTAIHMLMVNAINRGVLTAICAALNLILFLAIPSSFYFFLGLMLSIYMNSMLATLNTRQHILHRATMVRPSIPEPMSQDPIISIGRNGEELATLDFSRDNSSEMRKKRTFLDDMI